MFAPRKPYGLWDSAWDAPLEGGGIGPCRHLLLIRHGQYDETSEEDERRGLTLLGRRQAELTARRLARMSSSEHGLRVSRLHVSEMRRARETADVIAAELRGSVARTAPDPDLNEGMPALTLPGWEPAQCAAVREDQPRAEAAFRRYFHRGRGGDGAGGRDHECEVIVGHANVLRYFVCRALQLPPEAWLRMHIFNCSVTYLIVMPDGRVQVRLLGDVGHLPEELVTFSGRRGWNWYGKPTKCLPSIAVVEEVQPKDAA